MGQRSSNLMFIVSFFIIFNKGTAQNTSELVCYDCDPEHQPDQCGNVARNGVTEVSCYQKSGITENSIALCMSAYVKFYGNDANRTGIYRGCQFQNASIVDFCDYFTQQRQAQNVDVIACLTCNTTLCNSVNFTKEGEISRGHSLYNFWYTFLAVSALFSTIF